QEAADTMLTLVNSMPDTMAVAADLIVENMDIPGAETLANRLKKTLPPGMVEEAEMSEEQQAQIAQQAEAVQQQQQLQSEMAEIAKAKARAEVAEIEARTAYSTAQ